MSKNRNNGGSKPAPVATQQGDQQQSQDTAQDKDQQQDQSQEQQQNDTGDQQDQSQQNDSTSEQQSSDTPATGDQNTDDEVKDPAPAETKEEVKDEPAPVAKTQHEGFTPVYKVELELTSYAEAMDKKNAVVPEDGGKWQRSLFNTIKSILAAKDQEEFNREWNTMLMFFNKNKDGIFNENYMFRFPECWPGSGSEFTTFRRIVYVILQTADAKGRNKALREINMQLVTEGLKEAEKVKLLNFYQV